MGIRSPSEIVEQLQNPSQDPLHVAVAVHGSAAEISNIRPRERGSHERCASLSGSIERRVQKESTYENRGHTRPDEAFGDSRIGGLESLQVRVRLAFLEKELHLPTQAIQCPDAQRYKLLRGECGEEEDMSFLLRHVDADEPHSVAPSAATDSFDEKIDILPGQGDLFEPLTDDRIDVRESPIAADDAWIRGSAFRSANDVAAGFSDAVEILMADVAGVGEEQLVLERFRVGKKVALSFSVGRDGDGNALVLVETVRAVDFNGSRRSRGKPSLELVRHAVVECERCPVLAEDNLEFREIPLVAAVDRSDQLAHEMLQEQAEELRETRGRQPIVKRLVGHGLFSEIREQPKEIGECVRAPGGQPDQERPRCSKRREFPQSTRETRLLSDRGHDIFRKSVSNNPGAASSIPIEHLWPPFSSHNTLNGGFFYANAATESITLS